MASNAETRSSLTASATAQVQPGQATQVPITLQAGPSTAKVFLVHFRFDKAFVEPCEREVLRRVVAFSDAHPTDKIVIAGHTDRAGPRAYNQSLSERRARAVFAVLTFGSSRADSLRDWNELRARRKGTALPTLVDDWGLRQAQHMLQDLNFYPGNVDGKDGPLTQDAIRAFRCRKGLAPGTTMNDDVWKALIEDYLARVPLDVPVDRFLTNCPGEILKWLGCGEEDPVKQSDEAHRPSRRVEILFVRDSALPCQVPEPDTFRLPEADFVGSNWCLGPGSASAHGCFASPVLIPGTNKPQPCTPAPGGSWCREPAEPGTLDVQVSIVNENGTPAVGQAFVLTTPNGEFLAREAGGGEPVPARTLDQGKISFTGKRVGTYHLEVRGPVLARLSGAGDETVRGNAVCATLRAAGDKLDVVLVNAPVLREIRLPVAVHLLTALDPATHQPRPSLLPGNEALPESATLTAAEVRELFDGGSGQALTVNLIWRQARIRFEIRDVIRETFEFPGRSAGSFSAVELSRFLGEDCCSPNAVNLFFTLSLQTSGGGDGGATVSPESATVQGFKSGASFVAQHIQASLFGAPFSLALNRSKLIEVVAHELGHFVLGHLTNRDHPAENDPANAGRLMLPSGGLLPTGKLSTEPSVRLVPEEVSQSRSRRAASFACVPLTLEVQGAVRVGGELSQRFFFVRSEAPSPDVEVTARISDALAAVGTVKVECATAKVEGRRCLVSTAKPAVHEIEATYTPASGEGKVTTRVVVWVVSFRLLVLEEFEDPDLRRIDPFTVVSRRSTDPAAVLTLFVELNPRPFVVPEDLITWSDTATRTPDPFRRTVSRSFVSRTIVTVTIAGVSQSVAIEIFDLFFTDEIGTQISEARIEGITNGDRKAFNRNSVLASQRPSLFRLRADLPAVKEGQGTVTAQLIRNPLGGPPESKPVDLTRQKTAPMTFLSDLFLAIPVAIDPATLTLTTPPVQVIRARAGDRLRLDINAAVPLAGLGVEVAKVRGRVVHVFARILAGADFEADDVRRHVELANTIWTQAGIEVRLRGDQAPDLSGFDDLRELEIAERDRLIGLQPPSPPRSQQHPDDIHVYYVEEIAGDPTGITFSRDTDLRIPANEVTIAIEERPNVLADPRPSEFQVDRNLAHELGHAFIRGWPTTDDHTDLRNKDWDGRMLMHRQATVDGVEVDRSQVQHILTHLPVNVKLL